jgi:hypothetical protein
MRQFPRRQVHRFDDLWIGAAAAQIARQARVFLEFRQHRRAAHLQSRVPGGSFRTRARGAAADFRFLAGE